MCSGPCLISFVCKLKSGSSKRTSTRSLSIYGPSLPRALSLELRQIVCLGDEHLVQDLLGCLGVRHQGVYDQSLQSGLPVASDRRFDVQVHHG